MSNETLLNVTRQQLARIFNSDPRLIKAFEDLFKKTFVETPARIDDNESLQNSSFSGDAPSAFIDNLVLSLLPVILTQVADLIQNTIQSTHQEVQLSYSPPVDGVNDLVTRQPTLVRSTVALSDGAGVGAGTLSNAPISGNPTKWLKIDDNGTTRYIPSW